MKTNKLYYTEPYLKKTEAVVTSVFDNGFTLDKTIFYPECGGQRGDSGWFGKYRIVTTVEGDDDNPLHVTDGPLPQVGEKAELVLDWDERYFSMVEHTSQHLLSSVLYSLYGIKTVAVHHGKEEITIETDSSSIDESVLFSVEDRAMELVGENRRVWMEEMDRDKAESLGLRRTIKISSDKVRVVFIENQDKVPCGGVHIASLGEIGEIVYTGLENIRGEVRTHWRCGKKAKELRRENAKILKEAEVLMSADSISFVSELKTLIKNNAVLKKEVKEAAERAARGEYEEQVAHGSHVWETTYSLENLVDRATKNKEKPFFIIGPGDTFMFVGEKALFDTLKEKFKLQGGGREPLFRGKFTLDKDNLLHDVENILCSL